MNSHEHMRNWPNRLSLLCCLASLSFLPGCGEPDAFSFETGNGETDIIVVNSSLKPAPGVQSSSIGVPKVATNPTPPSVLPQDQRTRSLSQLQLMGTKPQFSLKFLVPQELEDAVQAIGLSPRGNQRVSKDRQDWELAMSEWLSQDPSVIHMVAHTLGSSSSKMKRLVLHSQEDIDSHDYLQMEVSTNHHQDGVPFAFPRHALELVHGSANPDWYQSYWLSYFEGSQRIGSWPIERSQE